MAENSWTAICGPAQGSAATLFNTYTAAKSVLNRTGTLPANFFNAPGKTLRIRAAGALSNLVTTPGTVTFQIMMGSIIVWSSGAVQLNASAHVLLPFILDVELSARAVGAGTSCILWGIGELKGPHFTRTITTTDTWGANAAFGAGAQVSDATIVVPVTAPAAGTGFDSTIPQSLDFWVGFSVSNAANGVQMTTFTPVGVN